MQSLGGIFRGELNITYTMMTLIDPKMTQLELPCLIVEECLQHLKQQEFPERCHYEALWGMTLWL
jgi:hypothetical protein